MLFGCFFNSHFVFVSGKHISFLNACAFGFAVIKLVYVHRCVYDGEVKPSQDELDGGRFWTKEEILENMGKEVFTPNFENEYKKYFM